MVKFSVGFNFENDFLRELRKRIEHVSSIYFPIPCMYLGSGRTINEPPFYENYINDMIRFCKEFGIRSLMLLNATCEGERSGDFSNYQKLIDYLKSVDGLSGVIVTNPILMKLIRLEIPSLEIQASVNCYIKSVKHARYVAEYCDVITIDRDINRNIGLIKKIKDSTGKKIKIMVNEGCLCDCPFRHQHYNLLSHGFEAGVEKNITNAIDFISHGCESIYHKEPWRFFTIPFIRPEDLHRYGDFTSEFKLSTRIFSTSDCMRILDAYITGEYDNLVEILDTHGMKNVVSYVGRNLPNDFFERISGCDDDCDVCNYCRGLFERYGRTNEASVKRPTNLHWE